MESAGDYKDYAEYEKSYKGLQIAIDNRLREDTDITAELKILAAGYRKFYETETRRLKEKLDIAANRVKALEVRLSEAKDNLRNAYQRQELSYVKMRLKNMISHSGIKNC